MFYRWLADVIVAFHVGYVLFIVLGLFAIVVGRALGWQWVHNRWFRTIHFLMIAVVAFEAVFGLNCPLTSWESSLRRMGGETVSEASFIGRMLHALIFLDLPSWAFNVVHVAFALLVLGTFWLVPVRWRPREDRSPAHSG